MSIIFGYSGLLVEDCEDAWTAGAHATCTADTGVYKIGSKSAKQVVASAGATEILCYEDISAADLSGKTHVAVWIYSSIALAAGDIQLLLDNTSACASPLESINFPAIEAGIWSRALLTIATPANCSAIVSVGIYQVANLADFTFYIDDVRAFNAKSFTALSVKGITDPENVENKVISGDALDFSRYKTFCASRRRPHVELTSEHTKANRLFLYNFHKATDQSIFYENDEVLTEVDSPESFTNEWLEDCVLMRKFTFDFIERTAWTTVPSSWSLTGTT